MIRVQILMLISNFWVQECSSPRVPGTLWRISTQSSRANPPITCPTSSFWGKARTICSQPRSTTDLLPIFCWGFYYIFRPDSWTKKIEADKATRSLSYFLSTTSKNGFWIFYGGFWIQTVDSCWRRRYRINHDERGDFSGARGKEITTTFSQCWHPS